MERRNTGKYFVFTSMFALLMTVCFVVLYSGSVRAEITLSYANFAPAKTIPGVQLERWKAEVEKRTNGKVKIQVYHGGTLLGAKNMVEGVVSGAADIGTFPPGYLPGRFPMLELFNTYNGWPSAEVATATLWDLFEKFDLESQSLKNLKVLGVFTFTPAHIMSSKPVRKLEDLKGIELRATVVWVKALELLGGKPIGMPMPEVPEAMKKGVVKGLISSLDVLKDFNFAEYCPFVTYCYLPVAPWVIFMNEGKWKSLPSDVKKVMDDMSREHSLWTGQNNDKHEKESVEWSKTKHNVKFITLQSDELNRWFNQMKPLSDPYMKITEGKIEGKIFWEEMLKLKAKYSKEFSK